MKRRHLITVLAAAVVAVVLSGCGGSGGVDLENPIDRRLGWFGFVNGDDLRRRCGPGAPDTVRLVYNGHYEDQVRVYELTGRGDGADLTGWLRQGTGLLTMELGDSLSVGRGKSWRTGLSAATAGDLWQAVAASGAYQPAPRQTLRSEDIWWLAVGCRDGDVFFNAWRAGTPRFAALRFRDVLAPLDPTGVAFAEDQRRRVDLDSPRERGLYAFRLEVGQGGLVVR